MPDVGVVPGLKSNSTLSRLILHPIIHTMHFQVTKSIKHSIEILIDDVALTMYSSMPGTFIKNASTMVRTLCATFQNVPIL